MKTTTLPILLLVGGTLPSSFGFQGIVKTNVITGHTPPPKRRIEPPVSELAMDFSFFADVVPDIRVLRYIQVMLADPENAPIILSAVSSFLVLAGIWSTTPPESASVSSNNLKYAPAETGGTTYQASSLMEPPTISSDLYGQQRSFSRAGMKARGSVSRVPPPAAKLPVMQDRYQPLSYAPMDRPGGMSPLKTMLKASSSSTLEKPDVVVAAPPKSQQSPPKRFSSSQRDSTSNSFDGPSNPENKKAFDWVQVQGTVNQRAGKMAVTRTLPNPEQFQKAPEAPKPVPYAPTVSSPPPIAAVSASSYLDSLEGSRGSKPKQSSYAPTKRSVTAMQVSNALSNSYFQTLGKNVESTPSLGAELPVAPFQDTFPGAAPLQNTGSYLESIGGGAKMKESSYAPTKPSVATKATGNALGNSYFAAMGSGRSAPTTIYQYSPSELAARAALNTVMVAAPASRETYAPESVGASKAQGSYLDTVGGVASARKESSYAPTKPSVMTKPMGNAMGSTYFASLGASGETIIPPSYSYLLTDEPEPPTAGTMKPYLLTLSKEVRSGARPSSYAPTKSAVGKMSSTTVGSSYLQMMGKTSSPAISQFSADPGVSESAPPSNSMKRSASSSSMHSNTTVAEGGSYFDVLSGESNRRFRGQEASLLLNRQYRRNRERP